jgi:predicted nucleic acid-binding protein
VTLVLDASVLTEVVIGSPVGRRARRQVAPNGGRLHIPDFAIIEATSALRGLVHGSRISAATGDQAILDLVAFPARRWPAARLARRVWELRDNVSAYDAVYVALAEALQATLLTADERLARGAAGVAACPVETVQLD